MSSNQEKDSKSSSKKKRPTEASDSLSSPSSSLSSSEDAVSPLSNVIEKTPKRDQLERRASQISISSCASISLGNYSKKNKPKSLRLFNLNLGDSIRSLVDGNSTRTLKPKVTEEELEDQEEEERRKIATKAVTIPLYSRSLSKKRSSSQSTPTLKRKSPSQRSENLEEENSDGYCTAVHIEYLTTEVTSNSESSSDSSSIVVTNEIEINSEEVYSTKEVLARRAYNPQILGHDEEQFNETRFGSILASYIPKGVPIQPKTSRHTLGRRGEPYKYHCGLCSCLKLYIVITLTCCIMLYMWDSCYRADKLVSLFHERNETNTTITSTSLPLSTTGIQLPAYYVRFGSVLLSDAMNIFNAPRRRNDSLQEAQTRVSYSDIEDTTQTASTTNALTSKRTLLVTPGRENCTFKSLYICLMALVIGLYLTIFLAYTCGLVVRFYNFGWFLCEAIFCFALSGPLFICSFISYFFASKPFTTTFVLMDSLFVFLIGYWTYHKRAIYDPLSLINHGTDMDEIAQILARRQFSKWFSMNTQKVMSWAKTANILGPSTPCDKP